MIKFFIEFFFKEEITKRKEKRINNSHIIQTLLDTEHAIRDNYNAFANTNYTTAKALDEAVAKGKTCYNRHNSLVTSNYSF